MANPYANWGGGSSHSTQEQVVGTYIDGKPLYQKTVTGVIPNASTNGTEVIAYVGDIIEVDNVIEIYGTIIYASSGNILQLPWTTSNGYRVKVGFSASEKKVMLLNAATAYNGAPFTMTMQYTKTTDSV